MTVAATAVRQQRGKGHAAKSFPQPTDLLAWYDRHRRALPWRAPPGKRTDPYRVWLSEIMLQQTTVKAVAPYYARFLARWPDVQSLAAAPLDDVLKAWAGLGYYARARNLHACARAVVERHGGQFPHSEDELRALPGIGAYTAAAIAAIAYDAPAMPVDGNVERVIARLYAVETPLPAAKPEIGRLAQALSPARRSGDFAQADDGPRRHHLHAEAAGMRAVPLERWLRGARCAATPKHCRGARRSVRARCAAAPRSSRSGPMVICWCGHGRPRGLLGGMTEVPTTEWTAEFEERSALEAAPHFPAGRSGKGIAWRRIPGLVRARVHAFSARTQRSMQQNCRRGRRAPAGMRWVALQDVADEALPSLMRKVLAHARAAD